MAMTTISHELEAKYPEFKGRFGETIELSELNRVISDNKAESKSKKRRRAAAEKVEVQKTELAETAGADAERPTEPAKAEAQA